MLTTKSLQSKSSAVVPEEAEPPSPISPDQESTEPPPLSPFSLETHRLNPWSALREPSRSDSFRREYFPGTTKREWNSWEWQLANSFTTPEELSRVVTLSAEEEKALLYPSMKLPLRVTPYYLSLIDPGDPEDPLRRSVVPLAAECFVSPGEAADPLDEEGDCQVPGIVHRYPDRVLFLVTGFCSTYCRYCTRSRKVGDSHRTPLTEEQIDAALAYIASHKEVRDVLVSGGDPLTLSNDRLESLLARIRKIPHVEFLRIGTKVPAVLPQRVTPELVKMLKRYHPLWISIHFTHPREITPESAKACERLADAGIPLGSQTVLLKGINDDTTTLKRLFQRLLAVRVRPYYLYQCDPIIGSAHFRTNIERGLELISSLRGFTTGYAVPTYVVDAPGGGGKVPLYPSTLVGREENRVMLKNYQGRLFTYPLPLSFEGEESIS
ncbi:MAG TPA: KamA family radical SAM protein [Candidatus Aminicenantes bacterium]|nr:KamA family radical SAM protein [Candidatus Aminicenantes bacterium]